ncbi:hypothetical protein N7468_005623 [Penicillium chermesinum]|uniref:Amino acid permease/ SLC12A domain-containing protein n=1 Tax=Penicillium chermesinum TaxID=63820 RepID=A0A9W9NZM5_9EURO|nr:uncharacterized protein N7468_005623 [Penicillium chermesinum]KAJ5232667.1 hypothetical protein N7468_005623 [Penicillium chermesinum]
MFLGPTLGTGLFIGAGQALAVGGPGSLLISYIFLSLLTYFMATAVAEVAAHSPVKHGTLITHGFLYMRNSMGFAAACLRWYTLAMFVPYEMSSAMVNLGLWNPDRTTVVLIGVFTVVIVGSNFLSDRKFRSSEVLFYRIKLGNLICLLVLSLSVAIGGASGHESNWGFRFWRKPGAFHEYLAGGLLGKFWGLMQCLLNSSIAFTLAPELIVQRIELAETVALPEANNETQPVKSKIIRKVNVDVAQCMVLYILSSLAMGIMAPFNEPLLTNAGTGAGLSPFIIGINAVRIRILPVTATLAILLSSIGSARSFLHLASHTLCALAEVNHAPRIFAIRNKWGVPWAAVVFTSMAGSFGFLCAAISSSIVTTYFMLFLNSSGYLSWLVSCGVYWRFRHRLRLQGVTNADRFAVQPFATYFGFASSAVMLVANGLVSVVPGNHNGPRGCRAIMAYIGIPAFCAFYLIHKCSNLAPSRFHSLDGSLNDAPRSPRPPKAPKAPTGRFHLRAPAPVASQGRCRVPHGRFLEGPTAMEVDQEWVVGET